MSSYSELKSKADEQWRDLVAGDKPWIRVGTAMCGHAAGAFDVVEALKSFNVLIRELQALALDVELIERPKKQPRRSTAVLLEAEKVLSGATAENPSK